MGLPSIKCKGFMMLCRFLKLYISLLFVTVSLFATADGPDYFNVRGVAYNDVLWMHPRADYRSPKIQGIPPNASCVKNLGCNGRWCKVSYGGVVGWVNGRYLAEGSCNQPYNSQKSAYSHSSKTKTIQIPQVSWGACMVICEDIKFCKNADHNRQSSICTLTINTEHPSYRHLYQRCSHIPTKNWRVSYHNDQWMIFCR